MTICVAVKIAEGLVMAADSASMLEGTIDTPQGTQRGVVQTFSFANKVSRILNYPIGIMSWGIGSISDRSIQSLIMEFEYSYPSLGHSHDYKVKDVADSILEFIKERYNETFPETSPPGGQRPALGLFVGGYSSGQFFAESYEYRFPKYKDWKIIRPDNPDGRPSFGADWFGQNDPLRRLIKGISAPALSKLIDMGADQKIVQQWVDDSVAEFPLIFDGMPIQDAIDFANFAVQVTIGCFRFGPGAPLCGGDVDIAIITPDTFQWAQRKQWAIKE